MSQQQLSLKKTRKVAESIMVAGAGESKPSPKGSEILVLDETRIAWKTIERKKLTACGVKPIGKVQWNFKAYYL
jgi:hypothetical protein